MMRGAVVGLIAAIVAIAAAAPAQADDVVSIPVTFTVANVNTSAAACDSDGKTYALHGELVAPRALLAAPAPAAVTLYLHEYSFDDFWHFRTVPGVDYATALARAGHASVTIDRLGYDDSPQPDGSAICLGAHADMAHQIIAQLRAGTYAAQGSPARAFAHVVLAGHSVGAVIAELEAYSFHDEEALMLFGHSDGDYSSGVLQTGLRQGATCSQGGDGGPAPNYAFFGTPEESRALGYYDVDPAVLQAQLQLRHRDPCGDVNSLIGTLASNRVHAGEIDVPVLLLYGRNDATLADGAGERQSAAYTGSSDVETAWFDRAGHALALERVAPQVQATAAAWLTRHGLRSPGARPAGRPGRNAAARATVPALP